MQEIQSQFGDAAARAACSATHDALDERRPRTAIADDFAERARAQAQGRRPVGADELGRRSTRPASTRRTWATRLPHQGRACRSRRRTCARSRRGNRPKARRRSSTRSRRRRRVTPARRTSTASASRTSRRTKTASTPTPRCINNGLYPNILAALQKGDNALDGRRRDQALAVGHRRPASQTIAPRQQLRERAARSSRRNVFALRDRSRAGSRRPAAPRRCGPRPGR